MRASYTPDDTFATCAGSRQARRVPSGSPPAPPREDADRHRVFYGRTCAHGRCIMTPRRLILAAGITAALSCSALAQQEDRLGRLTFPTSCDPKVQAEFERGVAMIH